MAEREVRQRLYTNWEPLTPFYAFARFCSALVADIFATVAISGYEHIPREGPLIVAPNHLSYFDPPLVGALMPRQVHFMAKRELFTGVMKHAMRGCRTFPVNRGTADRKAIHQALDYLKEGRVIGVFPQGTRDKSGGITAVEAGLAMIAEKSGAPVLPIGLYYTNPKTFSPGFMSAISAKIGPALRYEKMSDNRKEAMELFNRKMIEVIGALIEEARRDVVLKR